MLMFVSVGVMAQEPYKVFCELLGTAKLFSNKVAVAVARLRWPSGEQRLHKVQSPMPE